MRMRCTLNSPSLIGYVGAASKLESAMRMRCTLNPGAGGKGCGGGYDVRIRDADALSPQPADGWDIRKAATMLESAMRMRCLLNVN